MKKIIRTSTIPLSLDILLKGQLSFLNEHYKIIAVSGADSHLDNVQHREGVQTIEVSMSRTISPFKDFISLCRLYFLFKKEKPQIVHSITPKAGLLSMLAAKMAGVTIRIHTFTGLVFPTKTGAMQRLLILMDKLLCYCATNIYPEGNGVKDNLVKYGITTKQLEVLVNGSVNGINLEYFNPKNISSKEKQNLKRKLNLNNDDFIYIFVGRLVTDKGINELIDVFNQLSLSYNDIKLLLVGAFESDLDPLKNITNKIIKNNNNIISVGYQDDIRTFLSISNVFVFPSYREGFPNVVMQAGAMGIPSIVTNINGSNEIIIEEINGVIIEPKDTKSLKSKMIKFYKNREFHLKLKNNSRINISNRYDQKLVWHSILNEYKNLLLIN